jgi:uncharacterized protein YkwD
VGRNRYGVGLVGTVGDHKDHEGRESMTERPFVPAEPGWPAGVRPRHALHRRAADPPARPRRRPPGRGAASALSMVLGVAVAMLLTWPHGGTPVDLGAPASVASLADGGARAPADRAGRGEPRSVPAPAAATSAGRPGAPGRAPAPVPARTLVPAPQRSAAGAPAVPVPVPASDAPLAAVTDEVVRLTNLERAKVGCGPLHVDARLTAAAAGHSADMAERGYFSHTTPEGKSPWDRAKAAGYADPSAENIAMGYRTPAAVVAGWMGSAGHRANIQNCASHAIGVGYNSHGFYWTQLFGYV